MSNAKLKIIYWVSSQAQPLTDGQKTKTKTITGKIIKNNKQAQEKTTNQTTNNYKTSKELNYEALYQFITTAEGYYNYTTTQTYKNLVPYK